MFFPETYKKIFFSSFISLPLFFLDQWTKKWIVSHFFLGERRPIIFSYFDLTLIENKGGVFGLWSDMPDVFRIPIFFILPLLAFISLGIIFYQTPLNKKRQFFSFSLILSGALGNFWDRLMHGYVIDFILCHWNEEAFFPAFNVADSAISVGMFLLFFDFLEDFLGKNKKEIHVSSSV